jgi:AcrR family transcriptional regulator
VEESRRVRKKAQVRESITAAAFALFAGQGFEATTVEDISEAADVARTTFFRYFASKEEVLTSWMLEVGRSVGAALNARPSHEAPLVALGRAFVRVASEPDVDGERGAVIDLLRTTSPAVRTAYLTKLAHWEDLLTPVLATRMRVDSRLSLEPRLYVRIALAAVTSAQDTWVARGRQGPAGPVLEQAFRTLSPLFDGD